MPKRKFNSTMVYRRKRMYKRVKRAKRSALKNRTRVKVLGPAPIPMSFISKMKYCETFSRTADLTGYAVQVMNLNSIYDPNRTGSGHQPYGHDTFETLYNKYRVFACHWRVSVFPVGAVVNSSFVVTPVNGTDAALTNVLDEAAERPRAIHKVLHYSGAPSQTVRGKTNCAKLMGLKSSQYKADEQTSAVYGTNPSEAQVLGTQIWGPSSQTYRIHIQMIYYVESFDPKPLSQS